MMRSCALLAAAYKSHLPCWFEGSRQKVVVECCFDSGLLQLMHMHVPAVTSYTCLDIWVVTPALPSLQGARVAAAGGAVVARRL